MGDELQLWIRQGVSEGKWVGSGKETMKQPLGCFFCACSSITNGVQLLPVGRGEELLQPKVADSDCGEDTRASRRQVGRSASSSVAITRYVLVNQNASEPGVGSLSKN